MSLLHHQLLARKRLLRVTSTHGAALVRTLEHKICDGGPYGQRVNPHILTPAKQTLLSEGELLEHDAFGAKWYSLTAADPSIVAERIAYQGPIHAATSNRALSLRVGQALEIAIDRGLREVAQLEHLGGFLDLDDHDDTTLYRKDGPPSRLGKRQLPRQQKLDFLVRPLGTDIWAGLEAKNIRAWLYPNSPEFRDLIRKALLLEVVPILVARRIPYLTGALIRRVGGLSWETLRQRYPFSETELAEKVRHKRSLGYADVVVGNHCDAPLAKFLSLLPSLIPDARVRLDHYRDLLEAFDRSELSPRELSILSFKRERGLAETVAEHDTTEIPF